MSNKDNLNFTPAVETVKEKVTVQTVKEAITFKTEEEIAFEVEEKISSKEAREIKKEGETDNTDFIQVEADKSYNK